MTFGKGISIDTIAIFLLINFTFLGIIFPFFIYLDIKFRKIPYNYFLFSYFIVITLNFFELLIFFENIPKILYLKIFVLILTFSLSFILFLLKIIGGSDGKLIILIFFAHPILLLNIESIFTFFIFFTLFFVIYFTINLIINNYIKTRIPFILFFSINGNFSIFQKNYMKFFYKFRNYSEIRNYSERKYYIKSLNLIFDDKKNKFQVLCQIRPPLIVFIILSYYLIFFSN